MRIAIPIEDGNISPFFGTVEEEAARYEIALYEIENNRIQDVQLLISFLIPGSNHAIVDLLEENLVYVVICDEINPETLQAIRDDFPTVYTGVKGDPDTAVQKYLSGTLTSKY